MHILMSVMNVQKNLSMNNNWKRCLEVYFVSCTYRFVDLYLGKTKPCLHRELSYRYMENRSDLLEILTT